MIKSTFLPYILLLIPAFSFAQITLDKASLPSPGETYYFDVDPFPHLLFKDSVIMEPQLWDYALFLENTSNITWEFTTPAANPYGSNFPDATVAVFLPMDSVHLFFRSDTAGLYAVGLYSLNSLYQGPIESNPDELYYPANFTLGDTLKAHSNAEIETTIAVPVKVRRTVDKVFTGIGFGNLITPEGLFQDVLLIKTETHTIDSLFAQFGPIYIYIERQVEHTLNFDWLRNGSPALLLNLLAGNSSQDQMRSSYTTDFVDHAAYPRIASVNDTALCSGDSLEIQIIDSGSYTGNLYAIQLSNPGGGLENPLTIAIIEADHDTVVKIAIPQLPAVTLKYQLRVVSGRPERVGPVYRHNLNLTGNPDALAYNTQSICKGDTIRLYAFGGEEFLWSPASGLSDSKVDRPLAYPSTSTRYTVTTSNACGADTASVYITVSPQPATSAIAGPNTVKANETATYSVVSHSQTSYTWKVTNGQQVSGGNTNIVEIKWNAAAQGKVEVMETNAKGCRSESQMLNVQIGTGIPEQGRALTVSIYPNPAEDNVVIQLPALSQIEMILQLIDMTGRTVAAKQLRTSSEHQKIELDLTDIPAGIYLLKLAGAEEVTVQTLVIRK